MVKQKRNGKNKKRRELRLALHVQASGILYWMPVDCWMPIIQHLNISDLQSLMRTRKKLWLPLHYQESVLGSHISSVLRTRMLAVAQQKQVMCHVRLPLNVTLFCVGHRKGQTWQTPADCSGERGTRRNDPWRMGRVSSSQIGQARKSPGKCYL
jgi:hypothetical protein